jgi:uncharacterized membrane protein YccC
MAHGNTRQNQAVHPLTAFWRTLTRYDPAKVVPEIAIRNTLGFICALALGTFFGGPAAGVIAGTGALNVSFSDSRDPYIIRARRMFLAAVLCGTGVTVGSLSGHSSIAAVAVATLGSFGAGMLLSLGQPAGDLGVITVVTMVVFAARPLAPLQAFEAGLTVAAGGLLQLLFSVALWPIRRYVPERRIVSGLFRSLAETTGNPGHSSSTPPHSTEFSDAQDALMSLGQDHSVEAERLVFLLNQAERIRLSLLNLGRLARRLRRDAHGADAADALTEVLNAAGAALRSISGGIMEGRACGNTERFQVAAGHFAGRHFGDHGTFFAALQRDSLQQLDALGGQLRTSAGTATQSATRNDDFQPWRLRFSGRVAKLQANLSLHSTVFRHAVRLALCVGAGDALGRAIAVQRTYWIPMTIVIILKPDFTATVSRGILRLAGTFAGLVLATVLFRFVHTGTLTDMILVSLTIFLLRWVGPANYGIFVTALSAMVVLLIATTGVAPQEVIYARALNTLLGGLMAMLFYILWPTWERTQAGPAFADMIDTYREYFGAVMSAYADGLRNAIDIVRVKSRRARSNAEASVDRLTTEPGMAPERVLALNTVLVSSHSFVHAVMALESGLYQTAKVPPRRETFEFVALADETLAAIADALRRGVPLPRDLPDLRAAHNRILHSREPGSGRYTLVNIETDRITTSVNTLAENVRLLASLQRAVPAASGLPADALK